MLDIEKLNNTLKWCLEYMADFQKSGEDFDPFRILTGQDSKGSKLNTEILNFLSDIDDRLYDFLETRKHFI